MCICVCLHSNAKRMRTNVIKKPAILPSNCHLLLHGCRCVHACMCDVRQRILKYVQRETQAAAIDICTQDRQKDLDRQKDRALTQDRRLQPLTQDRQKDQQSHTNQLANADLSRTTPLHVPRIFLLQKTSAHIGQRRSCGSVQPRCITTFRVTIIFHMPGTRRVS